MHTTSPTTAQSTAALAFVIFDGSPTEVKNKKPAKIIITTVRPAIICHSKVNTFVIITGKVFMIIKL